jgi:ubiquitin C-terminal hydrolase
MEQEFSGRGQQCAHEAFCTLIAACEEVDVRTVASFGVHASPADVYTTPWWQMMGFMTTSTTHCRQCDYRVCKYDPQTHLSVPLCSDGDTDVLMLEQLLSASLGREELDDADDRCSRCDAVGRVRNVEMVKFPKTLVLHLKRWSQNVHGAWVKNDSHVEFPFELDLSSSQQYKLRSLVIHSGNAGGGHYTALVRTDEPFFDKGRRHCRSN